MRYLLIFVLLLIAPFLNIYGAQADGENNDQFRVLIGEETANAIGYAKLSIEEKTALQKLVTSVASSSALYKVAYKRMEREGWEPVKVLGSVTRDFDDFLIIQVSPFSKWAVEEPLIGSFFPGDYWAKTSPLSGITDMIDQFGDERSFLFSETIELD